MKFMGWGKYTNKIKRFGVLFFWGSFLILFQNCAGDNIGKVAAGISNQPSSGTALSTPVASPSASPSPSASISPSPSPSASPSVSPSPSPSPSTTPVITKPKITVPTPPKLGDSKLNVGWSINTTDTSFKVYCRLVEVSINFAHDPIICPNPITWGPLGIGNYELDFFIDGGSGINAAQPDNNYTWFVPAVDPVPTPSPSPSASPSVSPTPTGNALKNGLLNVPEYTPHSFGAGEYEIEAPTDQLTANYYAGMYAKKDSGGNIISYYNGGGYPSTGFSNGQSVAADYSKLTTFQVNGVTHFGSTTDSSGLKMIRHAIYKGDVYRHQGNRSEFTYNTISMVHGVDYWFAWAWRLDSDWTHANSGGSGDRQSLMQVHQQDTSYNGGGPMGIIWEGGNAVGSEMSVGTVDVSKGSSVRYTFAAKPGQMQRVIMHLREGLSNSDHPIIEMWVANGTETMDQDKSQLKGDRAPGAFIGDTVTNTSEPDYPKIGIYKWDSSCSDDLQKNCLGNYGNTTKRGLNSSGLFYGKGVDLFNESKNALAPYAVP